MVAALQRSRAVTSSAAPAYESLATGDDDAADMNCIGFKQPAEA
jgi:hypothetical protein